MSSIVFKLERNRLATLVKIDDSNRECKCLHQQDRDFRVLPVRPAACDMHGGGLQARAVSLPCLHAELALVQHDAVVFCTSSTLACDTPFGVGHLRKSE